LHFRCLIQRVNEIQLYQCNQNDTFPLSHERHLYSYISYISFLLKMLGPYLYILIIGLTSCNMLSLLRKKLQSCVTNNVFLHKQLKSQQEIKKSNLKTLAGAGNWTRDLSLLTRMRYICPTESTESTSVVKQLNCLDAMGRNVNKQSRICGPHIFNKFIFSGIYSHAWITIFGIFLIFTGVGFTANI